MKKTFLLLIAVIFLTCGKKHTSVVLTDEPKPTANFTSDKTSYTVGEQIYLTNTSADAANLLWTLPDGTNATGNVVTFKTDTNTAKDYIFKLEAFSKSGLKSNAIEKSFSTFMPKGKITLYSASHWWYQGIHLTLDGVEQGTCTLLPNMPSDCAQTGYTNFNLDAGVHSLHFFYSHAGNWINRTENFTITPNGCLFLNVY